MTRLAPRSSLPNAPRHVAMSRPHWPGRLRQARGAAGRVRLAAIAALLGDQVVLRADRVIVVQRVVVRDAEHDRQLEDRARLQVDVVEVQPLDADRAQRLGEHRQLAGQREIQREALAGARPRQLDRVADRGLEEQHLAARIGQRDEVVHVAPDAAAPGVRHEQRGCACATPARRSRSTRRANARAGSRSTVSFACATYDG